jgi:hypothetical protein
VQPRAISTATRSWTIGAKGTMGAVGQPPASRSTVRFRTFQLRPLRSAIFSIFPVGA